MGHQLHNYTLPLLGVIIAFTLCPHVAKATDAVPGKQVQQSTTIVTDGEKSSIPHWTYLPKSYNDNANVFQIAPLIVIMVGSTHDVSTLFVHSDTHTKRKSSLHRMPPAGQPKRGLYSLHTCCYRQPEPARARRAQHQPVPAFGEILYEEV